MSDIKEIDKKPTQNKKRRRLVRLIEYFQINFTTVQGLITLTFVANTVAFVLIIFFIVNNFKELQIQRANTYEATKPINYYATQLISTVRNTKNQLNQFILLNDVNNRSKIKENWLIVIPAYKDSLLFFVNKLNNLEAKVAYANLTRQLVEIRQLQQQIEVRYASQKMLNPIRKLLSNDLMNSEYALEKTVQYMINLMQVEEIKLSKQLTENERMRTSFIIIGVIFALIMSYSIGIFVFLRTFSWLRLIRDKMEEVATGNLIKPNNRRTDEFKGVARSLNTIIQNLTAVKEYANEVGKGNFETNLSVFDNESDLGKALKEMGHSLAEVYQEEQRRIWFTNGLAKFADILRDNSSNLEKLCSELIANLIKQLDIIQGGVFILNDQDEKPILELKSAYAYGREKFTQKTVDITEGLIGRAFQEKEMIYLTDIPEKYLHIVSGLGQTEPKYLLIVPLENEERQIKGIIELASLKEFPEYYLSFIKNLCQNVASAITVVTTNQQNQRLLNDYKEVNQRLQQQESKLLELNENLNENNQKLLAKLQEIEKEYEKLGKAIDLANDGIVISDTLGLIQYFNKSSERIFGFTVDEVLGRNVKILMPSPDRENHHVHITNYLTTHTKKVLGTSRQVEGLTKDGTIMPLLLKLGEITIGDEIFFVAIFRKN